jgi:hypothetical protein
MNSLKVKENKLKNFRKPAGCAGDKRRSLSEARKQQQRPQFLTSGQIKKQYSAFLLKIR